MNIVSTGALFDALREHRLLTAAQLAEVPHLAQGRCGDARALARLLVQRGWLSVFQANQILAGEAQELAIGSYIVLDRLGQGGLSQVFKARHIEDENWIVALKLMRLAALLHAEGRRQFLREMEAMARLDHPNIVQFCDLDEVHGTFYFTMEFIDGTDLGKHVDLAGPLGVAAACDFIHQAALGLQHAHEHSFIHRDIKPANLFLTHASTETRSGTRNSRTEPRIKILDWGLARLRRPHEGARPGPLQPAAGGIIGTADYIAPEQARDPESVDIRGDIYSLGCTLYFLLTGQPPFPQGSLMEKILQHQSATPEPVTDFRDDVPPELLTVLTRMMAKDATHRYQTPAALALALAPFARKDVCEKPRLKKRRAKLPTVKDNTPLPAILGVGEKSL